MRERDGSADEIEITPEMIEAGASAVLRALAPSRLYAPMTEEDLAKMVFEAMSAVSPPKLRTGYVNGVG